MFFKLCIRPHSCPHSATLCLRCSTWWRRRDLESFASNLCIVCAILLSVTILKVNFRCRNLKYSDYFATTYLNMSNISHCFYIVRCRYTFKSCKLLCYYLPTDNATFCIVFLIIIMVTFLFGLFTIQYTNAVLFSSNYLYCYVFIFYIIGSIPR